MEFENKKGSDELMEIAGIFQRRLKKQCSINIRRMTISDRFYGRHLAALQLKGSKERQLVLNFST
jgi:hypothetical protein